MSAVRWRTVWLESWRRGGLGWLELARRVARQIGIDEVFGRAAQIAFHAFFALIPLLVFLTALLGYLVEESAALRAELFRYLEKVIPSPEALSLVRDTLEELQTTWSGGKLSLGLLASIWVASTGMGAVTRALNKAFGLAEKRPWWLMILASTGLTLAFAFATVSGLVLLFYGEAIGRAVAQRLGLAAMLPPLWNPLQWLILLAVVTASFDLVYNLAPGQAAYRWRWATPGAVLAGGLWIAASLGLRIYLQHVAYSRIYGSLGTVIALLVWFYLSGLAILAGGEINSEIWKAEQGAEPGA